MKKNLLVGAIALFLLGSCHGSNSHNHAHEGHAHETETSHEGHNHEHEGHNHAEETGTEHAAHNHENEAEGHGGNEIVLPEAKAKAAGVEVSAAIKPAPFSQVIRTSGQVLAAQGSESTVVATVNGVVRFHGKLSEGMAVGKGATLLTLSSKHIAEGDPVQKARIAYEVARKEYERKKALVESKIVSEKDYLQAEQTYENARIAYEAVSKGQSTGGQSVASPMSGFVKNLLVNEGDYVSVGQPLMSITQTQRLQLRADVSEKYYAALRTLHSAHFKIPYNNKVYLLDELNGRLLSYGHASGGSYVPVTFEFDNRGDILPGAFVEIYLLGTEKPSVIALPHSALTEEQGSYFVYRQLDAECYEKQLVTLGADNGKQVEILSGVKAGDRIVIQGAYQVKLASATNAIPAHSHEH